MSIARYKDILRVHTILPLFDIFVFFTFILTFLIIYNQFLYILEKRWLV